MGVAAMAVVAGQASAADNLIPGKITLIKPGNIAKGIFKPAAPATFPIDGDPTASLVDPPSLQIFDTTAPGAGFVEYDLIAANWTGLGNPAGSKGYKYKGAGTPADPCKIVLVKEKVIKFICKGSGVTLAPPTQGGLGAVLKTQPGSRYCGLFGGQEIKNDPTQTKRKDAAAPGECPFVPGPAVCGDSIQQQGEQCDDGDIDPGDGCSENCEIESLACSGGVIGSREVTVSLDVPAGEDLATARVTVTYPNILTGIPGVGDSSFVEARISGTPVGNILVNDQDGDLTVAYIGLPPNVIPNGMTTQFVVADFDSCVDISRDFCSRNQQVIDCCNDVGGDPMQSGCPLNPPVCPAGQFPAPGGNPAPCVTIAGACPTGDFCLDQLENMVCNVSDTNDANGLPVAGVTCTITVNETIVGPTTTTSSSSSSTSSTSSTTSTTL
jgi:cysteine-rich repeat protein